MSGYQQRDNNGSLFKNDRKDPKNPADEKKPDYTGEAIINGEPMRLSAWIKNGKNNSKFMSIAFSPKDGAGNRPQRQTRQEDDDEGSPF